MDWNAQRYYNRPISKEDIRYVLYFAEEAGLLVRQKKGRSYQLYLPSGAIGSKENAEIADGKAVGADPCKHSDKIIANAKMRLASKRKDRYERAISSDFHPYLMYRTGNKKNVWRSMRH